MTDFPGFDERADAEALRKAMKGLGKVCLLGVLEKRGVGFSKHRVVGSQ